MAANVWRLADRIYRPATPWTPSVHALLRHLEEVGYRGAPRLVGTGVDDAGRQVLTFVEGQTVHPGMWTDEGIVALGTLLRDLHAATATFRPPPGARWMPWHTHREEPDVLIGHGDAGPWNLIARGGLPVAFVDWELAGPVSRLDEVAEVGRLNCQLHSEDVALLNGLPPASERARQLRLFVDAYGLDERERNGLVDRMIHAAIRGCANDTDQAGITPSFVGPHRMVWGMAWQARGARWLLDNRMMLEDVVTAT